MASNTSSCIHRQRQRLILLLLALQCLVAVRISGFVVPTALPTTPQHPLATDRSQGDSRSLWEQQKHGGQQQRQHHQLRRSAICRKAAGNDDNNNYDIDNEDEDHEICDFYFDVSKDNIDSRSSMDAGIHEMLGGRSGGSIRSGCAEDEYSYSNRHTQTPIPPNTVVVMDWECILDALPYHIELGIHAARTTWPHLNELCNFDTDREWLENKLFAMSHVLGSPDGPDQAKHVACEFALATRLILEEQALDRNESTGKNGRYARKFHPRSAIHGNHEFEEESPSRRPLTAGELAVNWREFIRSTLIVKYSRRTSSDHGKPLPTPPPQDPMKALEDAIEDYLSGNTHREQHEHEHDHDTSEHDDTPENSDPDRAPIYRSSRIAKSLPLFPQTKFALRNSSTKLVVRISHKFDNDIVARSLNKHFHLLPHERIAKTYKPENAIRRLFLNEDKNIVLLLRPDYKYEFFNQNDTQNDNDTDTESNNNNCSSSSESLHGRSNHGNNGKTNEENCLTDIMKFTHQCDNNQGRRRNEQQQQQQQMEDEPTKPPTTPSVIWVDSSWHRLQGLAPVFGDTIPGGKNAKKNTAKCSVAATAAHEDGNDIDDTTTVWLSLWLAEWPANDTGGTSKTKKRRSSDEAAMVYPWTDSLSWDDAEDILIPATWGSSDTAFQ